MVTIIINLILTTMEYLKVWHKKISSYYSFNETITNGSYLFKEVICFKEIDLSKMDCSKMIDAPKIFENSNFKIIYFGASNESYI